MFKKMMIILMLLLLSGCSNDDLLNQISEKDAFIKEISSKSNEQTTQLTNLENEYVLIDKTKTMLEETILLNDEEIRNLKIEVASLINKSETLASEVTAYQSSDTEISVLNKYFTDSLKVTKDVSFLVDEIINKTEAIEFYFEAQHFNNYMFRYPEAGTFTPKDDHIDIYGNDIDKSGLELWFLVNNDGETMTKKEFDNRIRTYFTENISLEFSQYIVDLNNGAVTPTWSQPYGVYNNLMYSGHFSGANSSEMIILRDYCTLDLEYISDNRDLVRYKIHFPVVYYDDYLFTFKSMKSIEEIIEFKKTVNGWRLNVIPKTYESEM